jgi:hypothetical protein
VFGRLAASATEAGHCSQRAEAEGDSFAWAI